LRVLRSVMRVGVLVYIGLSVLLYLFQDRLLFHPQPLSPAAAERVARSAPQAAAIQITASDGTQLHGWLSLPPSTPAPMIIYFGGNAEEVSWMVPQVPRWPGWAAACVNYRGFGQSAGSPSEEALFADALRIYDALVARPEIDKTRVVAFGRSLGTGVAVHLAAERKLQGLFLATPYDSIRALAQERYPVVPVGLLLRHPFDSLARVPSLKLPALVIAASEDRMIPPAHARRLFDALAQPKRWQLLQDADHGSIVDDKRYWRHIDAFLLTL
jgi:hypothetical protein